MRNVYWTWVNDWTPVAMVASHVVITVKSGKRSSWTFGIHFIIAAIVALLFDKCEVAGNFPLHPFFSLLRFLLVVMTEKAFDIFELSG